MTNRTVELKTEPGAVEVRYRPLYARVLGLRYLRPGGMLCFVYLEGTFALSLLLALAELVSWWVVLILPVSVALMVKVNDLVAGAVARSAARTPERERERVRREVSAFMPMVGRAAVVTPAHTADPQASATSSTAGQAAAGRASNELAAGHRHASGEQAATGAGHEHPAGQGQAGNENAASQGYASNERAAGQGHASNERSQGHTSGEQNAGQGHGAAVGRQDSGGRYAAAGQYLDAAWRQHAYAMAHQADHADQTSQRERQSASRRYE